MKIVLRDGICEICFCRVNQPCVFWGICMAVFMAYCLKIMNIGRLLSLCKKIRYIKKTFRYMKLSPDHKRSDFKIKSIRIIQPDLQAKEIQIIDVKEIYDRRRYNISREALQKLTESFEDHAKSLEGRTKQQDQSAQMLEDAIRRSSVWKNSSQRAQQFLAAQDKKKENPENLPEHFSENVIKAGAMFRDKFVKNGQENNVSIQNLLSDISLW